MTTSEFFYTDETKIEYWISYDSILHAHYIFIYSYISPLRVKISLKLLPKKAHDINIFSLYLCPWIYAKIKAFAYTLFSYLEL